MELWQGGVGVGPVVGINNTGSTQFIAGVVWPPGVMDVHPLPAEFAVVGWRSPMTGAVTVTGGVNDLDASCGDGILWSIDHFQGAINTTLASGFIPEGGSQDFQNGSGGAGLASIPVKQGDFLYFVIDPNSNHICDSTELTVSIRPMVTVIEVAVDIKPGSFPNSINPRSRGVIPVAILSTKTFDATTVDPMSVRFGPSGAREAHGRGHRDDVNRDGKMDLVLHFSTQDTGIVCGDTSISLTGTTVSGQAITGSDSIRTVGCK